MRELLPAAVLAIAGLCALTVATLAPSTDESAIVVFNSSLTQQDRLVRAAHLGGSVISIPSDGPAAVGRTIFVTFETLPTFQQINDLGIIAILSAVGASGCAGQQV
ncbi:MAG: hypothetical protein ACFB0Z_08070 [Candidatus Phaeomarinobacter sp.]